ncbi:MAG: hypothetical protein WCT11_03200 [Candidatus Magasanikbacteria bacterium]|jgi:hypothetical protein
MTNILLLILSVLLVVMIYFVVDIKSRIIGLQNDVWRIKRKINPNDE